MNTETGEFRAAHRKLASVRTRLVGLGVAMFGVVLVVLAIGVGAVLISLRAIERQDSARRVERTRAFLQLQARIRRDRMEEYAYWDEMWDRADRPVTAATRRFFVENFVEWFPVRYDDALIRVWNRDGRVILDWTDSADAPITLPLPGNMRDVPAPLATGGFVATNRGLVVFSGAAILPSDYRSALDEPHGYLIVAGLVSDSMIANWSAGLQTRLRLLPLDSAPRGSHVVSQHTPGDSIETRFVLDDPFGHPAAVVAVASSRAVLADIAAIGWSAVAIAGLILAVSVTLMWRLTDRLVTRPLGAIVRDLREMKRSGELRPLAGATTSFEWAMFVNGFNGTVRALEASQRRYHALFDGAVDGMFLLEAESGVIVEANPAALALLGNPIASLRGRTLSSCLGLPEGPLPNGMMRVRRADGSGAMVSILSAPVDANGMAGTLASVRDLTEHEALRTQVRDAHAQKMEAIGTLAGGVAHDYNNLMGAMLVSIEALRDAVITAEGLEAVDTIDRATRRASELTKQLLRLARRDEVQFAALDLCDVVRGVAQLCRHTLGPGITVQTLVPDQPVSVKGDTGQLEQALLNLCINARDAMDGVGTLRLALSLRELDAAQANEFDGAAPGLHAVMSVTDTGSGMPPEIVHRIFEPFFTTKPAGKGTGLGLAMVYGTVRAHGGAIRVHSVQGRGTRFDLVLPTSAAAVWRAAAAPPRMLVGTETILLVDDEELFRRAAATALRRLGYTVLEAGDGAAGIAAFLNRAQAIDLVVTDMAMPHAGGPEVFRAIRDRAPTVPVLVCSGYPDGEDIARLIEAGVSGVLTKPFDVATLASTIRATLDGSAMPLGA